MTDKYILVKVRDAEAYIAPRSFHTKLGKIRKAIHSTAEDHDISMADMVTHSLCMTADETRQVTDIFETAMARVKRDHQRRIAAEWKAYYEDPANDRRGR